MPSLALCWNVKAPAGQRELQSLQLIGLVLPSLKGTSLTAVLSKKTGGFDLSVENVNSKAPF